MIVGWLTEAEQLAQEHADWLAEMLRVHGVPEEMVSQIKFHYHSAFVHGFKHAVAWMTMSTVSDQGEGSE